MLLTDSLLGIHHPTLFNIHRVWPDDSRLISMLIIMTALDGV